MTPLREDCIDRVGYALEFEVPEADPRDVRSRAEALIAIAEHYRVPIDPVLLNWVHYRVPGKEWSGDEWTRFCAKYAADRAELAARLGAVALDVAAIEPISGVPDADPRYQENRMLCPRCYAHEALLIESGRWVCPACGEIE